jgi:hypothetical protein
MTPLALSTWIAVAVLVIVPPVVFVLFLRDARRVFEDLLDGPAAKAPPVGSGPSSGHQNGRLP